MALFRSPHNKDHSIFGSIFGCHLFLETLTTVSLKGPTILSHMALYIVYIYICVHICIYLYMYTYTYIRYIYIYMIYPSEVSAQPLTLEPSHSTTAAGTASRRIASSRTGTTGNPCQRPQCTWTSRMHKRMEALPRPSNYPLLDSKYHQIKTIRFQLRVLGGSRFT